MQTDFGGPLNPNSSSSNRELSGLRPVPQVGPEIFSFLGRSLPSPFVFESSVIELRKVMRKMNYGESTHVEPLVHCYSVTCLYRKALGVCLPPVRCLPRGWTRPNSPSLPTASVLAFWRLVGACLKKSRSHVCVTIYSALEYSRTKWAPRGNLSLCDKGTG